MKQQTNRSETLAARDAEFFKAYSKDKTLTRARFNKEHPLPAPKKDCKCGFDTVDAPTPALKKIYSVLTDYCGKFPGVKTPNLVFSGATGTGKTFTAKIIADDLSNRGFFVHMTTAFAMVNAFRKFDFDDLLECDLLVIDDLGTEPVIKNITLENLYNILNERILRGRAFIITTNLSPSGLIQKYDQRIASRILSKETSTIIEFKGDDLRLKV